VRACEPLIERLQLRQLPRYFPKADHKYRLDPEYEPEDEHGNVKEPVDKEKVAIAQLFKSYRDAGLLKALTLSCSFTGQPAERYCRAHATRTRVLVAISKRQNIGGT